MPKRRNQFEADSAAARIERTKAETALVGHLASEIKRDLAGFDPTRLADLGPQGLRGLLQALELTEEGGGAMALPGTIKGWADRRRPEPWHWIGEVSVASFLGLATALVLFMAIGILS
ncbi:hypothetical protein [Devosia faecipullorum]|uniref:hypothetical protein n=1 Tax=Devosia faecipullorum TaxID=2755039 RepID=UPI00187BB386|nr:hypothetical protein [Devosia faecipullorum]MBE7734515.1 hypothetical protein [Devosia faecipullorum]